MYIHLDTCIIQCPCLDIEMLSMSYHGFLSQSVNLWPILAKLTKEIVLKDMTFLQFSSREAARFTEASSETQLLPCIHYILHTKRTQRKYPGRQISVYSFRLAYQGDINIMKHRELNRKKSKLDSYSTGGSRGCVGWNVNGSLLMK